VTDGSADGHHYNNDMQCKWKLYTPTPTNGDKEVILLNFPTFELEPNQFCMFYDYVSISWKDHTGTNKVKTLCNNRMGQVYTIEITGAHDKTNPVTVNFKSSRSNAFSGFKIDATVAKQVRNILRPARCFWYFTQFSHTDLSSLSLCNSVSADPCVA
jgi:hypothetical protein